MSRVRTFSLFRPDSGQYTEVVTLDPGGENIRDDRGTSRRFGIFLALTGPTLGDALRAGTVGIAG